MAGWPGCEPAHVPTTGGVLVSWRLFAAELAATSFHIYRNGDRITPTTIAGRSNHLDPGGRPGDRYTVRPVTAGVVGDHSPQVTTWAASHLDIPLQKPPGGRTPDGVAFDYLANDASVGDVDGDGQWNGPTGWLFSADGRLISNRIPAANHLIWWDGDLNREILDHTYDVARLRGVGTIGTWDHLNNRTVNLLTATGTYSNNTTKGNPSLQADLFGDWREEVIWRTADSTALRLFATPYPSPHGFASLMHDPVYRLGVAWQNVGYNQPPHTSYYLGTR